MRAHILVLGCLFISLSVSAMGISEKLDLPKQENPYSIASDLQSLAKELEENISSENLETLQQCYQNGSQTQWETKINDNVVNIFPEYYSRNVHLGSDIDMYVKSNFKCVYRQNSSNDSDKYENTDYFHRGSIRLSLAGIDAALKKSTICMVEDSVQDHNGQQVKFGFNGKMSCSESQSNFDIQTPEIAKQAQEERQKLVDAYKKEKAADSLLMLPARLIALPTFLIVGSVSAMNGEGFGEEYFFGDDISKGYEEVSLNLFKPLKETVYYDSNLMGTPSIAVNQPVAGESLKEKRNKVILENFLDKIYQQDKYTVYTCKSLSKALSQLPSCE